jgi:hypothetical protein
MKKDFVSKRFDELLLSLHQIEIAENSITHERYIELPAWEKWATNVLTILEQIFGESSSHYQTFLKVYTTFNGNKYQFDLAKSVFLCAKEDYQGDYQFDLTTSVAGEILRNFIIQAKAALNDGHKDAAAVLASAALESVLKQFALRNGLDVGDKKLFEVVRALTSKRLVSDAHKNLLGTLTVLHKHAMCSDWDKLYREDVCRTIDFVEKFLSTNFQNTLSTPVIASPDFV